MPPSSNTPGKTQYPVLDSKHFLRNVVDVGLSMVPDGDVLLAVNTKLVQVTTQELLKKKLKRHDEALEKKSAEVVQLKAAQRTYFGVLYTWNR